MFREKKVKPPKRFKTKHEESIQGGGILIIVDTHTGVNYISTVGMGPTSFTPLLDANGNIVIDPIDCI